MTCMVIHQPIVKSCWTVLPRCTQSTATPCLFKLFRSMDILKSLIIFQIWIKFTLMMMSTEHLNPQTQPIARTSFAPSSSTNSRHSPANSKEDMVPTQTEGTSSTSPATRHSIAKRLWISRLRTGLIRILGGYRYSGRYIRHGVRLIIPFRLVWSFRGMASSRFIVSINKIYSSTRPATSTEWRWSSTRSSCSTASCT